MMTINAAENEGIIRPLKGKSEPRVGPDALMVLIPSELCYLVQLTEAVEVSFIEMSWYHLYQPTKNTSSPLTLAGPVLGAPMAVMAMEKLIALGAQRIWVLGWCGSLQPDLRTGHIILPTGAVSEEGTSAHYPVPDRPLKPDKRLTETLESVLKKSALPFKAGIVWTTDALYRETPRKVKAFQSEGVLGVEMEISALMTLALFRSVAIACLLVVSDELFDLKWRPGFRNPLLAKNSRAAGKILLSLAGSPAFRPSCGR